MTDCLDDIQVEDALCGQADERITAHLSLCPKCHHRLAEAQSIRTQLRAAFERVHVSQNVVDRIRQMTVGESGKNDGEAGGKGDRETVAPSPSRPVTPSLSTRPARWLRHWGRFAIAAGLMLAMSMLVLWQWNQPSQASAAQELVRLHEQNLSGEMDLTHQSHDEDEADLSKKLGYKVAIPLDKGGLRMKGCCVAQFLGRQAGNLVMQGSKGPVSVIVSDVNEKELVTKAKIVKDGRTLWVCPMKGFYTVAVKHDGLIYCAVGDEKPEDLVGLLNDILNQHSE